MLAQDPRTSDDDDEFSRMVNWVYDRWSLAGGVAHFEGVGARFSGNWHLPMSVPGRNYCAEMWPSEEDIGPHRCGKEVGHSGPHMCVACGAAGKREEASGVRIKEVEVEYRELKSGEGFNNKTYGITLRAQLGPDGGEDPEAVREDLMKRAVAYVQDCHDGLYPEGRRQRMSPTALNEAIARYISGGSAVQLSANSWLWQAIESLRRQVEQRGFMPSELDLMGEVRTGG